MREECAQTVWQSGCKYLMVALICLVLFACANSPPSSTPAPSATAVFTAARVATQFAATPDAMLTPTPRRLSETGKQDDGQNLVLANPKFYWTLKLPRDWVVSTDTSNSLEVCISSP